MSSWRLSVTSGNSPSFCRAGRPPAGFPSHPGHLPGQRTLYWLVPHGCTAVSCVDAPQPTGQARVVEHHSGFPFLSPGSVRPAAEGEKLRPESTPSLACVSVTTRGR